MELTPTSNDKSQQSSPILYVRLLLLRIRVFWRREVADLEI